jgi:HSP20 family molecular chaperone IbpA
MFFFNGPMRGRGDGAALHDTLRVLWPTIAVPVDFAVPLDVVEDDEGFTLRFDVAGHDASEVGVRVEGNAVLVEGRSARRTFWLAAVVEGDRIETEYGEVELKVRVIKTRVAAARRIIVRRGP